MNSSNIKTLDPHMLRFNLTGKIDPRRCNNRVALSQISIYNTWKNIKKCTKTTNVKYQEQIGMNSLNFLMDLILYQIFRTISNT